MDDNTNFLSLLHFFHYADYKFIDKAWKDDKRMRDHLNTKFGQVGLNPADLTNFIMQLDTQAKNTLFIYIRKNHSNKW